MKENWKIGEHFVYRYEAGCNYHVAADGGTYTVVAVSGDGLRFKDKHGNYLIALWAEVRIAYEVPM